MWCTVDGMMLVTSPHTVTLTGMPAGTGGMGMVVPVDGRLQELLPLQRHRGLNASTTIPAAEI